MCSSKRILQSDWRSEGIPFFRAREIVKLSENGYVDNELYISKEHYKTLSEKYGIPKAGDLMVTGVGTIGKVYVVEKGKSFYYKDASVLCFENRTGYVLPEFARFLIESSFMQEQIHSKTYGTTVNTVTISTANEYLCLIPPIKEQEKIVARIYEILNFVSLVEQNTIDIQQLITTTKSKILDLAIRGKLVPQDPNDEPASVLLERIRAEKEELIKKGKIKRDKKESVIYKGWDNSYYQDLPKIWAVSSLSEITTPLILNDGDWILSDNMVQSGEIKLIQLGSVGFLKYVDKGYKYLTNEMYNELNCTEIHSGYMLINRIVSDKMYACLLPKIDGKKITTVDTCWIAPNNNWYNLKYILYAVASPQFQLLVLLNSSGTTRKRISKLNLVNLPLALPPMSSYLRTADFMKLQTQYHKISRSQI